MCLECSRFSTNNKKLTGTECAPGPRRCCKRSQAAAHRVRTMAGCLSLLGREGCRLRRVNSLPGLRRGLGGGKREAPPWRSTPPPSRCCRPSLGWGRRLSHRRRGPSAAAQPQTRTDKANAELSAGTPPECYRPEDYPRKVRGHACVPRPRPVHSTEMSVSSKVPDTRLPPSQHRVSPRGRKQTRADGRFPVEPKLQSAAERLTCPRHHRGGVNMHSSRRCRGEGAAVPISQTRKESPRQVTIPEQRAGHSGMGVRNLKRGLGAIPGSSALWALSPVRVRGDSVRAQSSASPRCAGPDSPPRGGAGAPPSGEDRPHRRLGASQCGPQGVAPDQQYQSPGSV